MIINVEIGQGKALIKLDGRLDTITAPQFESEINALPADIKELVIDMEKLEYVSSAGLRIILFAQKKMSKVGAMKIVSVCEAVMEVFEITGFVDVLNIQ